MLAETHTHLDFFEGDELTRVIKEANQKGVGIIIGASMNFESAKKTVTFPEKYKGVYASVGIHPWNAIAIDKATYNGLKELSKKAVAISEIGLDFVRNMPADEKAGAAIKETQKQCLRQHLQLAREVGLPVIVHCRGAHPEMMEILLSEKAAEVGGVIHGFSGSDADLKDWLDLGFLISVGLRWGAPALPEGPGVAETYKKIPSDRLVLETDRDPTQIPVVATKLAELRRTSAEALGDITTGNLKRLLNLK